jgi:hypothetical protein
MLKLNCISRVVVLLRGRAKRNDLPILFLTGELGIYLCKKLEKLII